MLQFTPAKEDFQKDFFVKDILDYAIVLADVNEEIEYEGKRIEFDAIQVFVKKDDEYLQRTNIIGLNDGFIHIRTRDKSLRGKKITMDNIDKWWIEVWDDRI